MHKSLSYLFQGFQGFHIDFSDKISLCDSIKILSNRVNIHQAVVCHLNAFEIREEPDKMWKCWCTKPVSIMPCVLNYSN